MQHPWDVLPATIGSSNTALSGCSRAAIHAWTLRLLSISEIFFGSESRLDRCIVHMVYYHILSIDICIYRFKYDKKMYIHISYCAWSTLEWSWNCLENSPEMVYNFHRHKWGLRQFLTSRLDLPEEAPLLMKPMEIQHSYPFRINCASSKTGILCHG